MKLPVTWLKEYINISWAPEKLADALTMSGTKVEHVERISGEPVLEIEITTNRPDCLSHYGVARELAAFYGLPLVPFTPAGEPAKLHARGRRKDGMGRADDRARDWNGPCHHSFFSGRPVSPGWRVAQHRQSGVRSCSAFRGTGTDRVIVVCGRLDRVFLLRSSSP